MNTVSTLIREGLMSLSFQSRMEASRRLDIVGLSVILVFLDATFAWLTSILTKNFGSSLNVTIFFTKNVLTSGSQLIPAAPTVSELTLPTRPIQLHKKVP